jgi:hypothetical protein
VTSICATNGSCAFATGDLNVVMQRSTDRGATWSGMSEISPGFPASGGDSAPLVVEPGGRIDVLYQGYQITDTTTYAMNPAYSYFTASDDHGASWSSPVRVGSSGGTMSLAEWWIDGDIGIDASGTLYATWDTQGTNTDGSLNDVGWLSFSTDHGRHWSAPVQAPADRLNVPHIMEVVGGGSGGSTRLRTVPAALLDRERLAGRPGPGVNRIRGPGGVAGRYLRTVIAVAQPGRRQLGQRHSVEREEVRDLRRQGGRSHPVVERRRSVQRPSTRIRWELP